MEEGIWVLFLALRVDAAMVEENYGLEAYPYNTFKKHFYKSNCTALGGEWKNADQNFDNTFAAMLTLIQMSTTEGWVDVMYNLIDGCSIFVILYFLLLVFLGAIRHARLRPTSHSQWMRLLLLNALC